MTTSRPLYLALALSIMTGMPACQRTPELAANMPDTPPQISAGHADLPPPSSDQEADIISQMSWALSADPLADAQSSLASGAPELIRFGTRFESYPGLTLKQQAQISDKTSNRFPAGTGDVLYGEAHAVLRRALSAYAETYNQAIYQALR